MSTIRTAILSSILGLAALPALAGNFSFDLPRLDFPTAPEAARADATAVTVPLQPGN